MTTFLRNIKKKKNVASKPRIRKREAFFDGERGGDLISDYNWTMIAEAARLNRETKDPAEYVAGVPVNVLIRVADPDPENLNHLNIIINI